MDQWDGEHVEAPGVIERHILWNDIVGTQPPTHDRVDRVGRDGPVVQNRPLGHAGRASCITDHPRIIPIELDRWRLGGGVIVPFGRPQSVSFPRSMVQRNPMCNCVQARAEGLDLIAELLTIENRPGGCIADDALEFASLQAPVDYMQDRPQLVAGEQCI